MAVNNLKEFLERFQVVDYDYMDRAKQLEEERKQFEEEICKDLFDKFANKSEFIQLNNFLLFLYCRLKSQFRTQHLMVMLLFEFHELR